MENEFNVSDLSSKELAEKYAFACRNLHAKLLTKLSMTEASEIALNLKSDSEEDEYKIYILAGWAVSKAGEMLDQACELHSMVEKELLQRCLQNHEELWDYQDAALLDKAMELFGISDKDCRLNEEAENEIERLRKLDLM